MRHAHVQFVGGPLDGKVLVVTVNLAERVPREYRVPAPGLGAGPAEELVYEREEIRRADGRRHWRYAYVNHRDGRTRPTRGR